MELSPFSIFRGKDEGGLFWRPKLTLSCSAWRRLLGLERVSSNIEVVVSNPVQDMDECVFSVFVWVCEGRGFTASRSFVQGDHEMTVELDFRSSENGRPQFALVCRDTKEDFGFPLPTIIPPNLHSPICHQVWHNRHILRPKF
jgi:hypothetical protein